ncbi:uncharacterized protein Dwil_GK23033 [Drosophila willistoni]|uniref:superoxide dismutase n=1 Tax=Drosophila willistoni TaxID=7260 RepID=B4NMT0_DROWI|nr:copper chaperone for superoxide dismutase [Drosophila willistoni]EDW85669.1 uncharacterized protein Dwil_GK23033 [Drosophila willistoni]
MSAIKIEFAVEVRKDDSNYADTLRKALENMGRLEEIDLEKGRVIIQTQRPWSEVHNLIESTGHKAVLSGFGGQSAVAVINTTGSVVDRTPVQGVVRFTTITNNAPGMVVDGVVDGLNPGTHGLYVHESGDISRGCASVGGTYNPRDSPPTERPAGDLGQIQADADGRATFRFVASVLEVWDIIGRAVVITDKSKISSDQDPKNQGDERIACGIIARSAGILQNFKRICACDGINLWDERNKPAAGKGRSQKL